MKPKVDDQLAPQKFPIVALCALGLRQRRLAFASGYFAACNSTWDILVYRLKDYAEGKAPGPYFK